MQQAQRIDRWFNPRRAALTEGLQELVGSLTLKVAQHEAETMPRRRARRAVDQAVFERQAEALLCDALLRDLTKPGEWLTVSRSKSVLGRRSRYRCSVMGDTLPAVMDLLGSYGLLEIRLGDVSKFRSKTAKQTTFRASRPLLELTSGLDVGFSDFYTERLPEAIWLRAEKADASKRGKLMEYEDTEETIRLRGQVTAINEWLTQADIELDEDIPGVNPYDREVHRVFNNGRFDHGGRLGGGFWQEMSKKDRRSILIDGKPVATLDFTQMGPRIIYGMAGLPFVGDAYDVPGLGKHRSLVKQVFGAMSHVGARFNRLDDISAPLPDMMTMTQVCKAIEAHNASISGYFFCRAGMEAMRVESNIMVDILLDLQAKGIVALPVHDAVVVRAGHADEARDVMLSVFKRHTGLDGVVASE